MHIRIKHWHTSTTYSIPAEKFFLILTHNQTPRAASKSIFLLYMHFTDTKESWKSFCSQTLVHAFRVSKRLLRVILYGVFLNIKFAQKQRQKKFN